MRQLVIGGLLAATILYPLAAADPAAEIRLVLDQQQAAWNRGDARGFMEGYAAADSTTFVSSSGVLRGHARVLARYLERYPTREKMGRLVFSELEIQPLCSDSASVIGRWNLERTPQAGGRAGGVFTLLFRRAPSGWKILLDHTSSSP